MTKVKPITAILVLSGFMLVATAAPSLAQQRQAPADQPVPQWVQTFGEQLRTSLESDNPFIKRQALQHITYFASFYGDDIDFSNAVPALVSLYRRDDDANVRLFALVALYAIGDENGMQQVRRSMYEQRWPPRLQLVTMAALLSHYGPETFDMDEQAAEIATNLMEHYLQPRVEVGPLEVVQPEMQQEKNQ